MADLIGTIWVQSKASALKTIGSQGAWQDQQNKTANLLNAMRKTPESNVSNVYF